MEGLEEKRLIPFEAMKIAGAHARLVDSKANYVAADSDGKIYMYTNKPDSMEASILPEMGVWQYNLNDGVEGQDPIGKYTGNVTWHKTLLKIRS